MTADGELVPITSFPKWAQDCLYSGGHQSNLYPSAFETDEPILVCAPTRAGKVCVFRHSKLPIYCLDECSHVDLQVLSFYALHNEEFEAIYANSIQTSDLGIPGLIYLRRQHLYRCPDGQREDGLCHKFAPRQLWSKSELLGATQTRPHNMTCVCLIRSQFVLLASSPT